MNNPLYIVRVVSWGDTLHVHAHHGGKRPDVVYAVARPNKEGALRFDDVGYPSYSAVVAAMDRLYGKGGWTDAVKQYAKYEDIVDTAALGNTECDELAEMAAAALGMEV